ATVASDIASPIEPTAPPTWSPRIPTVNAPSTPPSTSKAFRHHAAARERTYVGNGSVANADVIATDPRPKKMPAHRTGSIRPASWTWNVQVAEDERPDHVRQEDRLAPVPVHEPP